MNTRLMCLLAGFVVVGAGVWWFASPGPTGPGGTFPFLGSNAAHAEERTEYHAPKPAEDGLADDRLEDKRPAFDPAVVDRRPLGRGGDWLVNASAAVLRLDVPLVRPDTEAHLLTLHPSYAAAVGKDAAARGVLPSVNLIDGKAKQFDDGLSAALDLAYYQGVKDRLTGHVELVRRIHEKVGQDSPAAAFLAAGLELGGVRVEPADAARKQRLLDEFRANEVAAKPIGFYTWSEPLGDCFRFLRFFQKKFGYGEMAVPAAVARALADDPALLADYRRAMGFYARLTNPLRCLSPADLAGKDAWTPEEFTRLCAEKKVDVPAVALFPPSTSKETVLFERLFPFRLPPDADLMKELVRQIRSGKVDLRPKADSGWYDHQVYALETLLLPEKGEERDKLLLTKAYKKRMLEAFQALITKRRETHVRQLEIPKAPMAAPPPPVEKVRPRLRLEPNPSYYLRTARSYAFLANFLEAAVGADTLRQLHGLKQGGQRPQDLHAELQGMRDLFYGLHLVSCEDIGLKPAFSKEEAVDAERCYRLAAAWLPRAFDDPDLAADTRVIVPVFVDASRNAVRAWATLGVRLAKLHVHYAKAPHLKPARGDGEWTPVEPLRLEPAHYLIAVDEFAEVELRGLRVLTREEFRAVCDREKTKEAILKSLRQ